MNLSIKEATDEIVKLYSIDKGQYDNILKRVQKYVQSFKGNSGGKKILLSDDDLSWLLYIGHEYFNKKGKRYIKYDENIEYELLYRSAFLGNRIKYIKPEDTVIEEITEESSVDDVLLDKLTTDIMVKSIFDSMFSIDTELLKSDLDTIKNCEEKDDKYEECLERLKNKESYVTKVVDYDVQDTIEKTVEEFIDKEYITIKSLVKEAVTEGYRKVFKLNDQLDRIEEKVEALSQGERKQIKKEIEKLK